MPDKQKIAFITCVSNETEYEECRYYLERLLIPAGYSADIISIREAPSMTAGYNRAMKDSDAKYKIYLHQDVYIKNICFIADMLDVFACDEQIGMLGMIGKKEMGTTFMDMMAWDTGKVIYNNEILSSNRPSKDTFAEVEAADGLLLATQYDIPWREDIFDGWDFYDLSQCMEFQKNGYKVVVPYQEDIWCCHNGVCMELADYYDYYVRFRCEYSGILGIQAEMDYGDMRNGKRVQRYIRKIKQIKQCLTVLFDMGERIELRRFFQNPDMEKNQYLTEYKLIVDIDQMEEQSEEMQRFWCKGMTESQLITKLHILIHTLKRIEYKVDNIQGDEIQKVYSQYAIREVCSQYVTCQEYVYKKLGLM